MHFCKICKKKKKRHTCKCRFYHHLLGSKTSPVAPYRWNWSHMPSTPVPNLATQGIAGKTQRNLTVGSKMWGLCYITNNWMRKRPARVKENQKTKYFFFCIYLFTTWHLYWFYFSSFSGKKKRERKKKKMWVELFECFEPILFTQELIGLIYSNTMNAERVKKILEQNSRV